MYEYIWCRFICPIELISGQGSHFLNKVIQGLTEYYVVVHKKSTPYYPQANGLAKLTNKTLQTILKQIKNENRTDWDQNLNSVLWACMTSYKTTIQSTPFRPAFGLEVVMPIEFQDPSLRLQVVEQLNEDESEQHRLRKLVELEEARLHNLWQLKHDQRRRKAFVDRHHHNNEKLFEVDKTVMLFQTKMGQMLGNLRFPWTRARATRRQNDIPTRRHVPTSRLLGDRGEISPRMSTEEKPLWHKHRGCGTRSLIPTSGSLVTTGPTPTHACTLGNWPTSLGSI